MPAERAGLRLAMSTRTGALCTGTILGVDLLTGPGGHPRRALMASAVPRGSMMATGRGPASG